MSRLSASVSVCPSISSLETIKVSNCAVRKTSKVPYELGEKDISTISVSNGSAASSVNRNVFEDSAAQDESRRDVDAGSQQAVSTLSQASLSSEEDLDDDDLQAEVEEAVKAAAFAAKAAKAAKATAKKKQRKRNLRLLKEMEEKKKLKKDNDEDDKGGPGLQISM